VGLQDDSMCLLTGGYSQEEIKHWCVKRNIGLGSLNIDSLNHRLELPCSSSRATRLVNSDANVCMLGPNNPQVRTGLFTGAAAAACRYSGNTFYLRHRYGILCARFTVSICKQSLVRFLNLRSILASGWGPFPR